MRILLTGGGTLGSASPLIAIAKKIKEKDSHSEFLWLGTKHGPERSIIATYLIPFVSIPAGKLRRYFSFKNITDILFIIFGFLKSCYILLSFKPNIIIAAGSYVQVPVLYASGIFFKRVHIIMHQQDIKKGLANSLCTKFAHVITVSTEKSLKDYPKHKTVLTGNPTKEEIQDGNSARGFALFKKSLPDLPVVLIVGGGTGSLFINNLVAKSLEELTTFCCILHVTGKDKEPVISTIPNAKRYQSYELLTKDMPHAYAIADIVVSRAGFATLTELAMLAKPTIIIPMPDTHQEENARYFQENEAVIVLDQNKLESHIFIKTIKELLEDQEKRFQLSSAIHVSLPTDANTRFLVELSKLIDRDIKVKKW